MAASVLAISNVCADVNAQIKKLYEHCERVFTETQLWENNLLPQWVIKAKKKISTPDMRLHPVVVCVCCDKIFSCHTSVTANVPAPYLCMFVVT